jgi:NhaC family Na+:H+ antiporter
VGHERGDYTTMNEEKKLNMPQSLLLLLLIIGSVAVCIRLKTGGPMIGLFLSWIIIYLFCKVLKINYDQIVGGAYDAIRVVVPTLCLLMSIGVMIGTWLQSGTIASIIVGGLKMINPTWLLPLTLVFCAVLSLVTGTSYGSVGSAGVAMMAIGNAMGIHPGMVAGAVICGAMFGDKLSPLSDTTNLAPAVAGSKLNDHVRSMLWTTLPTFAISLVLFTILGISQTSGGYEEGNLLVYIDALQGEFKLGFVTLLPAVVIIVLLLCKVNAIVSLGLSAVCAGAVSFFYQGATLQSIIRVAYNGYSTQIEEAILKTILNRGGMSSMLQYVAIICFAVGMGGMLDRLGVLGNILNAITGRINSDGSLILASLLVGYVTSLISCSQPMSHVLTGNMMKPLFKARRVAPEILSRTLEDAGTLSGPMIPWHGYCVYMAGTLGVAWSVFFPYLFLLYLTPLFSIFYGFSGISIKHVEEN